MTEQMRLAHVLDHVKDGDEHGWVREFEFLRQAHGHRIRTLTRSILNEGIRTPILIGSDGRVWDGHHRLYVAHALGFEYVPVEFARPASKKGGGS